MVGGPAHTDPGKYQVVFENDRVRVPEYRDVLDGKTHPPRHPDGVMYTLSAFQHRLHLGESSRDVVTAGFWISPPHRLHVAFRLPAALGGAVENGANSSF